MASHRCACSDASTPASPGAWAGTGGSDGGVVVDVRRPARSSRAAKGLSPRCTAAAAIVCSPFTSIDNEDAKPEAPVASAARRSARYSRYCWSSARSRSNASKTRDGGTATGGARRARRVPRTLRRTPLRPRHSVTASQRRRGGPGRRDLKARRPGQSVVHSQGGTVDVLLEPGSHSRGHGHGYAVSGRGGRRPARSRPWWCATRPRWRHTSRWSGAAPRGCPGRRGSTRSRPAACSSRSRSAGRGQAGR